MYNENGTIEGKYQYQNGKQDGITTLYDGNGIINMEIPYKNDVLDGKLRILEDGKLKVEKNIKNNKQNGKQINYNENGVIIEVSNFKMDSLDGISITYHDNGKIKSKEYYINGEINGKCETYFEDGKIESIINYKNGLLEGAFYEFLNDGKLKIKSFNVNGIQNGETEIYDEGEDVRTFGFMKEGQYEGNVRMYKGNKLKSEIFYKNGKPNGIIATYIYDKNDSLCQKIVGQMIDGKKNGRKEIIHIVNGEEILYEYYNYLNDKKDGECRFFFGNVMIISNYKQDEKNGNEVWYEAKTKNIYGSLNEPFENNPNWEKMCEGVYKNGKKNGKWTDYLNMFGTYEVGNYEDDKKQGIWEKYGLNIENILLHLSDEKYINDELKEEIKYYDLDLTEFIEDITERGGGDITQYRKYKPIHEKTTYQAGKKHGTYFYKDQNGKILFSGDYMNDLKDGKWIESFNEDEHLTFNEGSYKNGEKNGRWVKYIDGKLPTESIEYKDGYYHGELRKYNQNGGYDEFRYYNNGNLVWCKKFDENNKIIRNYEIINKTQKSFDIRIQTNEMDTLLIQEFTLNQNIEDYTDSIFDKMITNQLKKQDKQILIKNGKYQKYINGIMIENGSFKNGLKNNEWSFYYENYKVTRVFDYNVIQGIENEYFRTNDNLAFSGKIIIENQEEGIIEEVKVKDGKRNGKTTIIDIKTKTKKGKIKYKNGKIMD